MIEQKVKDVIARSLVLDDFCIDLTTKLSNFDSLDRVSIMVNLEDEFDISIEDKAFMKLKTIKQVVDYVEKIVGKTDAEQVAEIVTTKLTEENGSLHNSSIDAIFAAAKEWDDGHNNRAAINGFVAGVEWSQKQHQ